MDPVTDWLDRAILAFVRRVSGRTVVLTAFAFYPGLGLALPVAAGWTQSWLLATNVIGVTFAALISLGWLFMQLELKDRRHLLEWTTDLRHLTAQEFEWLVGELFRREGWTVTETGSQDGPDGNVDLELIKGKVRRLVQCKRWTSARVGVEQIRAFAGALYRERLREGVFVTFSQFTEQAVREAEKSGLELVDGRELYRRIERVRRSESCPTCQRGMVLDRSPHGWWFRCVTDGCVGKRDLGNDPARAVELLTLRPGAEAPMTRSR